MERDDLIRILEGLCRPVLWTLLDKGFTGSHWDEVISDSEWLEEYDRTHEEAFNSIGIEALDDLFDMLQNFPEKVKKWNQRYIDDFKLELMLAIEAVGQRDPNTCLKKIANLLNNVDIRSDLIEIIGNLHSQAGFGLLEMLLSEIELTDIELIDISEALSEIGGQRAKQVLERMKSQFEDRGEEVRTEIQINLKRISCEQNEAK